MKIVYLSLSEKRCTIRFYGCNFRCKGCFAPDRMYSSSYTEITPERLSAKIEEFRFKFNFEEVMLAGGEPTLYKKEILNFINLCDVKTILSTNGFLLDRDFITEMERKGLDDVHIDLKAYSQTLHEWYTGKSNQRVLDAIALLNESSLNLNFEVITVFIPGIVDKEEIERIAKFLSSIGENIKYRIIRYVPVGNLSRRPTGEEIKEAVSIAKKYLSNVTSSLEQRSHPLKRKIIQLSPLF